MYVGRGGAQAVRHPGPGVHPDVQLHAEVVLVPLLRLPHLRIPLTGTVLGGGRRLNDGGVHDGSLPQPHSLLFQMILDFRKQALAQLMPFQQVAEVENGTLIGERFRQPQPGKAPRRLRLVQQVLHGRIAQVVAQLHDMHPQHHRQGIGPPAPFPAGSSEA